ncbi:hypothetical protein [Streptomyces shaanxiensis]
MSTSSTARLVSASEAPWRRALRQAATARFAVIPRGGVVAHRVEHGQMQDVAADGVVEGVTAHLVGGLAHRAHGHVLPGEGGRRHQLPLHLRRRVHRLVRTSRAKESLPDRL